MVRGSVVTVMPRESVRRRTPVARRCRRADYDEIVRDLEAFWGSGDPERLATLRHLHHPMFVEELGDAALVIRDGGRVIAYLFGFLLPAKRLAYVHLLAARSDRQREGLATRLYRCFLRNALAHGCTRVKAITSPANKGSIEFHARLGMRPVGAPGRGGIPTVFDYSGPGAHRVVMVGRIGARAARRTGRSRASSTSGAR